MPVLRNMNRTARLVLAVAGVAAPSLVLAQPACFRPGPDVIVGDINGIANFAPAGEFDAVSLGVTLCNIGSSPVECAFNTNQHPIITQNLYRLRTVDGATRFEQIGLGWCFHTFFALSNTLCCPTCSATDGRTLGVGCADPHTASRLGSQSGLSPRWQVNASTGAFAYPPANPAFSGSVARRLQVRLIDLEPSFAPGAQYFGEAHTVAPDDATEGDKQNNTSYRPCTVSRSTTGGGFNIALAGTTTRAASILDVWRAADPSVVITHVDVPGDGRFEIGARVTRLASATWRYEYAVRNLSSHRSGASFTLGVQPGMRTLIANAAFHDVDYHDGDGDGNSTFDGTDWPLVVGKSFLTWATTPFQANPNANALRWGTLYNFRVDLNIAPIHTGALSLGLFRPGTPDSVEVDNLPVPGTPCVADWNASGEITSQDFFDFMAVFFEGIADANGDGETDSQDFFDFLSSFFSGC